MTSRRRLRRGVDLGVDAARLGVSSPETDFTERTRDILYTVGGKTTRNSGQELRSMTRTNEAQ